MRFVRQNLDMKYTLLLIAALLVLFLVTPDFILYSKDWVRWLPYVLITLVIPFLLFKMVLQMKSQWTIVIPFASMLVVGLLYGTWKEHLTEKDLQKNSVITKGIVIDTWEGSRKSQYDWYFSGEFEVDGKTYQTFSYNNQDQRLDFGDSITIRYSRRNPENNQVILE